MVTSACQGTATDGAEVRSGGTLAFKITARAAPGPASRTPEPFQKQIMIRKKEDTQNAHVK